LASPKPTGRTQRRLSTIRSRRLAAPITRAEVELEFFLNGQTRHALLHGRRRKHWGHQHVATA
jgi:hypothetical protein